MACLAVALVGGLPAQQGSAVPAALVDQEQLAVPVGDPGGALAKAKQVERRFYVKGIDERRCGVVDRNLIDMCIAIFYATALQKDSHTINAKAFAKLLNKQERKRLACNTVTPDTEEEL